ncbi:MAG: alpha/beta hydrolase, partial [Phycisphaerae bacterium]|nr:alpha/beta hydrolase [Phycisphaerae bacterium]
CGTGVPPVTPPARRRCHRLLRETRRFQSLVVQPCPRCAHGRSARAAISLGTGLLRFSLEVIVCIAAIWAIGGCSDPTHGPVVFYLDGAGWYGSAGSVKEGLRNAGFTGQFRNFSWSAYLGAAQDHFFTAKSKAVARRLAGKIEKVRRSDPDGQIHVMGLSAGTAVILSALEQLPSDVHVDDVVLFSPSVSADRNLTKAMRHVTRNLYATCSPHDGILGTLAINADGKRGPPAGSTGFRMPNRGERTRAAYARVVNLRWQPSYLAFDWNGGHTSVTNVTFVASVIGPRVLSSDGYPLDRSVADRLAVKAGGSQH